MGKKLVAYFSASGITKQAAAKIARQQGADLYEIRPAAAYTAADLDWTDKQSRSTLEMSDPESRPELAGAPINIALYDEIWLGFPIWWGVAPHVVNSFLAAHDFSGKTIHPFATSGGSGYGRSNDSLKAAAPGAEFTEGIMVH